MIGAAETRLHGPAGNHPCAWSPFAVVVAARALGLRRTLAEACAACRTDPDGAGTLRRNIAPGARSMGLDAESVTVPPIIFADLGPAILSVMVPDPERGKQPDPHSVYIDRRDGDLIGTYDTGARRVMWVSRIVLGRAIDMMSGQDWRSLAVRMTPKLRVAARRIGISGDVFDRLVDDAEEDPGPIAYANLTAALQRVSTLVDEGHLSRGETANAVRALIARPDLVPCESHWLHLESAEPYLVGGAGLVLIHGRLDAVKGADHS